MNTELPAYFAELSHLASPDEVREMIAELGMEVEHYIDATEAALEWVEQAKAKAAGGGAPPPMSIHLLLKSTGPIKVQNLVRNLQDGCIAPFQAVWRKP